VCAVARRRIDAFLCIFVCVCVFIVLCLCRILVINLLLCALTTTSQQIWYECTTTTRQPLAVISTLLSWLPSFCVNNNNSNSNNDKNYNMRTYKVCVAKHSRIWGTRWLLLLLLLLFRLRRRLIFVEPGRRWAYSPSPSKAPGISYQGTMKTSVRMLKTSGGL